MATKTPRKRLPPVTQEEAKRLIDLVDNAIYEFEGQFDHLEAAIGIYLVGRIIGWRPLLLIHNKRTIRRVEEILKINFRKDLPEETRVSDKSVAYKAIKDIGNFWKAVSGDISLEHRREAK